MASYRLLLDTHVVIWIATSPRRLPAQLLTAIRNSEALFVSHVSAWEIQIKHEKHGSRFDFSLKQLDLAMREFGCTELPIEYADIQRLEHLRFHHADPFDRLLIAQASRRPLYLATLDQNIVSTFESGKAFNLFTEEPFQKAQQ